MPYKESSGTKLYYKIIGEGIPTVILHGWGVDHRLMTGCMEPVFDQAGGNFKRIYIDLPGMGLSKPGKDVHDSHDILRIIYDLLDELIPGEPFLLIGESYGGYLARGILKERMSLVKGLILLCPLMVPGIRQGTVVPHTVIEYDNSFLATLSKTERDSFTYLNVRLTKEVWERFIEQVQSGILTQDSHFLTEVLQAELPYDVDELPKPYMGPTLIITGKQDTEVGYIDQFELQKQYCNGTYIAIAYGGHGVQIEQPEIFTGVVKGWLDSL